MERKRIDIGDEIEAVSPTNADIYFGYVAGNRYIVKSIRTNTIENKDVLFVESITNGIWVKDVKLINKNTSSFELW